MFDNEIMPLWLEGVHTDYFKNAFETIASSGKYIMLDEARFHGYC